jgi:hypothetical protein
MTVVVSEVIVVVVVGGMAWVVGGMLTVVAVVVGEAQVVVEAHDNAQGSVPQFILMAIPPGPPAPSVHTVVETRSHSRSPFPTKVPNEGPQDAYDKILLDARIHHLELLLFLHKPLQL